MNIPFIPEKLLEINEKYQVTLYKDEKILVIDNWYKNFDLFCEIVNQLPLPRWKWNVNGKNFIDYYDCRPTISFGHPDKDKINYFLNHIKKLIKNNFFDDRDLTLTNQIMEFNFYKNIKKNFNKNLQHFPHIDRDYNCIIYFDKVSSGGTALYPEIKELKNSEHINLLYNVDGFKKQLIYSKPNRLVIFKGDIYHGGYIENHNDYVDNWRINQVLFFGEKQ